MEAQLFQFGVWQVNPFDNSIRHGLEKRQMEPRLMDVLVALCKTPGDILSAEQLLEECWGSTQYSDNPVHKTIAQLRKLLGDQSTAPIYIETIRKRGYRAIAAVEYQSVPVQPVGSWLKESPFRGLQAFDEQHAPVFFGRSGPVLRLTQQIQQQALQANTSELLIILGASGSGKSSLVRAGLIPNLKREHAALQLLSYASFDLAEKGQHAFMTSLASILLDLELEGRGIFEAQSVLSLSELLSTGLMQVVATLRTSLVHLPARTIYRHALFLDSFEVIFDDQLFSESEREQALCTLDALARSKALLIILACRNDFYPRIVALPILMEAKSCGGHFDLLPPTSAEIAQIIRLPALAANFSFGKDEQSFVGLDDVLCQCTTGNPDALPLLQYTLQELYKRRSADNQLSFAAFHELGGIEGAIGHRAEQITQSLSASQRNCLPQIFSLVTTMSLHENIVTSRRATWAELVSEDERAVVTALVEARLFVSELVAGVAGFTVAHEALLRRWPRVVDWIDNHRHALQIRGRISELAARWSNDANNPELLLAQGKPLDEACSLLNMPALSLSMQERALIAASQHKAVSRHRLRLAMLWTTALLGGLVVWLAFSTVIARRQAAERPIAVERLMSVMLSDSRDTTHSLGQLELSDSARVEALNFFVNTEEHHLSAAEIAQRPKTLIALAEVSEKRNDTKSAKTAWLAAAKILDKQLGQFPSDTALLLMATEVTFNLAKIAIKENALQEESRLLQQALSFGAELHKLDAANMAGLILLIEIQRESGNVSMQLGKLALAEPAYIQVIAMTNLALISKPDDASLNEGLADVWFRLGTVKKAQGAFKAAMQLHQQEASLEKRLLEQSPQNDNLAYRLARALHEQAELSLALGQDQAALHFLGQAEQLYLRILRYDPSDHHWLSAIINTRILRQDILARHSAAKQDYPKQRLRALQAIGIAMQQQSQIKSRGIKFEKRIWTRLEAQLYTSIVRARLALPVSEKNQISLQEDGLKLHQAEQDLRPLLAVSPVDMGDMIVMVDAILVRVKLAASQGDTKTAHQICQSGYDLLAAKMAGSDDYVLLVPWLKLQQCLGNTEQLALIENQLAKIGYQDREYLWTIANR